jgi:V/A-type H+-transporting ATPase subunit D
MAIPPYGMAGTSGELDAAMSALYEAYPIMLSLAENEKAAQLLSDEIERPRRRVNSLEYILIPQLTAAIRGITMKLDENERGNLVRLMKVKDMMVKEAIQAARMAEGLET